MRFINLLLLVAFVFSANAYGSDCLEKAKVVMPVIGAKAKTDFEKKLSQAKAAYIRDQTDAKALIWYGRRTAYLGDYKKAIHIYSEGIKTHPDDARLYRHRGHRHVSIRCFDDAISDFEKAAALILGKPDEIEPDGLPNAQNIPTSTLQSNIWYHLGLAYFLKGDFENALKAYRECEKVSKNPDMLVATTNWLFITLKRVGQDAEAKKVLEPITHDLEIIENDGYYKLLQVYGGELSADVLLKEIESSEDGLSNASIGYGLGNWFLINGEKEKAVTVFRKITAGDQWSSFGYIAAEAELKRMNATDD